MNSASTASQSLILGQSSLARQAFAALLGSLLVAICAHVSIPLWFTPVPLTLQTFAVLFLGLILGPAASAASLILYLVEGMVGLPVFSPHGAPGFLHILGPTGGYLMAYPAAAALTGWLRHRIRSGRFLASMLAATAGSGIILLAGGAWFVVLTHQAVGSALTLTVVPFLPGDILKVVAAAAAASGWQRLQRL
jgi:biotin transport system substrate-specific component